MGGGRDIFRSWTRPMSLYNELKNIINQEIHILNRLLAKVREEKAAIMEGNPDLLLETGKSKETLALEMKVLEQARASLVEKMARAVNLDHRELTLTRIAELAPPEFKAAFRSMHQTMQEQVKQLEGMQEGNAMLIRHSLEHIQRSISLITSAVSANPTYTEGGRITGQSKKLISREV